jgi:hypothetical protein
VTEPVGPTSDTDAGRGRDGRVGSIRIAVAVVVLAFLAALGVVQWAAHERSPDDTGSFPQVEAAFVAAGLQVCAAAEQPDGLAAAALVSRTYELAVRCPVEPARVVVDRFVDATDRDAAARRFEALLRPRGSGVVYTLGETTIFVQGSGDHDVQERLDPALRAAGAR